MDPQMLVPTSTSEAELRHLADALAQRLDVLADGWIAGTTPTPRQIDAACNDIAVLRDLIAAPQTPSNSSTERDVAVSVRLGAVS